MSSRKRRILYIQSFPGGGSAVSLYELVRGLDTRFYAPIILFYTESGYRKQFEALGANVITLSTQFLCPTSVGIQTPLSIRAQRYGAWLRYAGRMIKPLYQVLSQDWPLARCIARLIRAESVDLVHHNNNLPVNRAAVIAACLTNTPQICHVRWFNNLSYIDSCLARFVKAFIYNSKAVAACYHSQGIAAYKGQVVYNPINVEAFAQSADIGTIRAEFGLTMSDIVVSNIGLLASWKGQDYFLQALAQVIHIVPQIKSLIVGKPASDPHEKQFSERLQHLVSSLGLSDHVIFTGFREDIPRLMTASDIIVHSASEPEPFGRVIVEAMAAGKPVIATASGGVLEIIEQMIDGLLVPPKNADAMATAILHLLNHPEEARLLAQQGQQRVWKRFSVWQHVAAIQHIYQHVLER